MSILHSFTYVSRSVGQHLSFKSRYIICYTLVLAIICREILKYHAGRTRPIVSNSVGRDQPPTYEEPTTSNSALGALKADCTHLLQRGSNQVAITNIITSEDDVLSFITEEHELFLRST